MTARHVLLNEPSQQKSHTQITVFWHSVLYYLGLVIEVFLVA